MAMSARELLANLPLQLAKGGSANKKQLLAAEKKYLANPDKRTGAQLYNMMLEQGVDVNDLLNAGVKQSTIDQVFTAQEPLPMEQFTAPTTAKSSLAGLEAQERERAIARGQSLVNKLQQGGVDAEERRRLQKAATQYGVTFEDMIRAGIDPSILFDVQLKQTPKGPQGTTGGNQTGSTVYTPGAVDPRGPGIDQAFRDSPVRERIPGVPEFDPMTGSPTGYRYTPAARLTPATGSGLSWTPPVVTSRPRQLLDVGGGYMPSKSTRFAESRAKQDQALMAKFSGGERPYNYADYNYWRNRLRAGEFNTVGGEVDVPKFEAAFNAWNESTPAPSSSAMTSSDQNTVAGTNQYPYNFYSNDYGSLPSYLGGTNAELQGQDPTGYLSRTPSATPITVGGAMMFNDGGFVKKPEGVVEESATPETESAQMLNRITAGSSPTAEYPLTEEGTVDWSQRQSPASQFLSWLTTGGERQARYLTENQNKSPIWDVPAQIMREAPVERRELPRDDVPDSVGQAKAMLRGLSEIPGTVADYIRKTAQTEAPMKEVGEDISFLGKAMYQGLKEDPIGFMLDMTPGIGQERAVKDAKDLAQKAIEAEAAGDLEAAKMYREMSGLSMSGTFPGVPGKQLSRAAKFTFKPGNVTRVRELPKTDIPQLEVDFKRHQSDIGSPEQLIQLANTVNPEFQNLLTNIATEVGVDYKAGPVKKLKSISDKLVRKDMGPDEIADSIRGTMLVNTNEQAEQIISSLSKSQAIIDEGWKRLPGNGYFDRKVSIQYVGPNGEKVLGELQLMTPDMLRAKDKPGGGHDLYAIERNYEKLYGRENIEQRMPPSEVIAYRQVKEDQLKTYNEVADRADPAIQREMGYQPVSDSARMLGEIDIKAAPEGAVGHGMPKELLVFGGGNKPIIPVVQTFTPANRALVMANINEAINAHPNAMRSAQNWIDFEKNVFGGEYVPAPPFRAIEYANDPRLLAEKLNQLTPDMRASADEGFGYVSEIKNVYDSGLSKPDMTGRLFLWGVLSRGAGPFQQEGAFIDLLEGASPYIDKAVKGTLTEADIDGWKQMVADNLPEGSPGKQVTMNGNAAGNLLLQLSKKGENGESGLTTLHNSLADPNKTGKEFRRAFYEVTNKPGIDNKVVSFLGLVAGKDDLLVMDRIQSRNLWDDGRFGGANIYDGINKRGLSGILIGPRGLMVTEMLENGLQDATKEAYNIIGRPQDASLGRMHWETWLVSGNQPVSHSTLKSVKSGDPLGAGVTEGKRTTFSSGATYRRGGEGTYYEYPLSDGSTVRMSPTRQKEFEAFIKNPKNEIVPKGFKVTSAKDTPWYTLPEIDRRKLDETARRFEDINPDGTLQSGVKGIIKDTDSTLDGGGATTAPVAKPRTGKKDKVTYEQFGGSLGDAKQKLGITEEQFKSFKDANKGIKQKRVPEVQEAAKKLKNGEITTQEYNKVVEEKMPIVPIGKVPKRPTVEEIAMSLSTKKDATAGGIVGVNIDVPDGTMISSRLDIPAYESYDTWVVTLHDGTLRNGNAVAYGPTAVLDNVTFTLNGTAEGPLRMATGEINKGTVARINGAWKNMDPAEVEQMAKSILDGTAPDASDWVEVGMNPFRHSYFYRKADGMPVADAEQVIQVGPLVLAKKAKTRPIESPEHLIDPGPPPKYFKRGGNVERVYNDRRYI